MRASIPVYIIVGILLYGVFYIQQGNSSKHTCAAFNSVSGFRNVYKRVDEEKMFRINLAFVF